jgi:hypothetical protein
MHLDERLLEDERLVEREGPWVSGTAAERRHDLVATVVLTGLIVLAFALRFWRLGAWGFDSDEVWMLRDSLHLDPRNPRPLLYLLNHYLVLPFGPLDEFSLRLLPALFGVLAIPAFYLVVRRLVGARAGLFGALLLAASGLHVYYSQFGRYWTLVFLLSAVYPFAIYLGLRERSRSTLLLGLMTGVFAVLAHPASVLLLGGLGIWLLATYRKRDELLWLWNQRTVWWGASLAVIIVAAIAVWFIPMLQQWTLAHDRVPQADKGGPFLLQIPGGRGVAQLSFLLGYVESLTPPLVLAAAAGIYLLWQGRDRSLALLLAWLFIFPIAFIMVVSFRTAISNFYLLPAAPVLFVGAGVFLDRLAALDWELRPRWLASALVAAMIIAANAPTLISQYRDGRRWDFRGVARWLDPRITPEDVVFSDQHEVLSHYLPGAQVQRLAADPPRLMRAVSGLKQAGRGGVLWIVSPAPSHAFRTNPNLASLNHWMYDNCQLRNTIGVGRVDFRQQYLQIYRCPPAAPSGDGR